MIRLLTLVCLLALASCSKDNSSYELLLKEAGIMHGKEVSDNDPLKYSVVALIDEKYNSICTGTIIAENIILTAAHCAPERPSDLKVVFAADAYEMITTREQDFYREYVRSVTDFKANDLYDFENEEIDVDTNDIALVKFKGSLPHPYKPAPFLENQALLTKGRMVTVVGYGVDEVITKEVKAKDIKNLEEAMMYGEVICNDNLTYCLSVEQSGDGLLRKTYAPIATLSEKEVVLNEKKAGTCNGDSGGPAFIESKGEFFLFGVTSRGSALCDDVGVYTNALEYLPWIKKTIPVLR